MDIKIKENSMKKHLKLLAIFAAVALLGLYAVAWQAGDETAKDPVCGMSVNIAGAAHTAEFQGKTYYFCSEGCKNAFNKEPGKFLQKESAEETPAPATKKCCGMCCMHQHGMMAGMKMMAPPVPATPGAPPVPPVPPAPGMSGAVAPDCPMAGDAPKACCKMMAECPMMKGAMAGHPMVGHAHMAMKMVKMNQMPGMHGRMGGGMAGGCPMCGGLAGKAEIVVENTKDGVVVKVTSKDPEVVKMIQERLAAKKAACDAATKKTE
jgi:YHS domain-containing protein